MVIHVLQDLSCAKVDMLGFGPTSNRRIILDEINALNKKLFESSHPFDARYCRGCRQGIHATSLQRLRERH